MRLHQATALAFAGVMLMSSPLRAAAGADAGDVAAVERVLGHLTAAWNAHDMDAFVAETTPDVDWVNVVGMHWRGREAVRRAHMAFHKGMFATSVMGPPDVAEIRELAPGVLLTVYRNRVEGVGRTPDGSAYPSDGAIMTMVLVRTGDGWRIAHAHNTNINAMAVAHDPGRGQGQASAPGAPLRP